MRNIFRIVLVTIVASTVALSVRFFADRFRQRHEKPAPIAEPPANGSDKSAIAKFSESLNPSRTDAQKTPPRIVSILQRGPALALLYDDGKRELALGERLGLGFWKLSDGRIVSAETRAGSPAAAGFSSKAVFPNPEPEAKTSQSGNLVSSFSPIAANNAAAAANQQAAVTAPTSTTPPPLLGPSRMAEFDSMPARSTASRTSNGPKNGFFPSR